MHTHAIVAIPSFREPNDCPLETFVDDRPCLLWGQPSSSAASLPSLVGSSAQGEEGKRKGGRPTANEFHQQEDHNNIMVAQCIDPFNMTEYGKSVDRVGFWGLPPDSTHRPSCCKQRIQLSATDILAPATMKNAAKCDT